jgi:hypothetical protein
MSRVLRAAGLDALERRLRRAGDRQRRIALLAYHGDGSKRVEV